MKANIEKKKLFLFFSIICLFLFNGCGLEDYIYIYPPQVINHIPTYETANADRYFIFQTNEKEQPEQFQGTAIYYKIYNKHSTMESRASSITSLISSTNESASAVKMIDTYGYKQLNLSSGLESPLIPKSSDKSSQKVYIRLTNYFEEENPQYNKSIVLIGQKNIDDFQKGTFDDVDKWEPRRNFGGNKYTFDFGRGKNSSYENYEFSVVPDNDDEDVEYSDSEDTDLTSVNPEDEWYVDLFAVGVGEDENFTQYYSSVLHLGSVAIDASSENN